MDEGKLRAWWSHRQGLDGSLEGSTPKEVLERSGWSRSVGGVGPYLSLYSRAGTSGEEAHNAVAKLKIHELPSARGCTYVVPASDFALALKVGQDFNTASTKTAYKLGVTDKEIDKLCAAVVDALAVGPLDPDKIRTATGKASRNLGEEGKKKGMTTTLPLALGKLQAAGEIRRVPVNGRLDQQRYLYKLWRPNPLQKFKLSTEEAYTELARRFFQWIGPATLGEFQWFSGLGVKAGKAAIDPLNLVPIEKGSDRLIFEEDHAAFVKFKPPTKPQYVLVSSLDAITGHRRDVRGLLDQKDLNREVFVDKSTQAVASLTDLPSHGILDRGRLIGLWEYDTDAQSIAWTTFGVKDKALDAAVKQTETFIRDEIGDARSFSLDSPKSRAPRIAALRAAAG
jgi:winged helix DNA-binding protein